MTPKQVKTPGLELVAEEITFDPGENLERERHNWKSLPFPAARVWKNNPCVVLGRFLSAEEEVYTARAAALGIPILRRPSGGGAVFHDPGNINYSLYLPYSGMSLRIGESLRLLSYPVARLLDSLDIPWEWVPPNNICVNGKKISGSAQARGKGRLLHHGTLLVSCDLDMMRSLLKPGGRSQTAPVINLAELLPCITVENIAASLAEILRQEPLQS